MLGPDPVVLRLFLPNPRWPASRCRAVLDPATKSAWCYCSPVSRCRFSQVTYAWLLHLLGFRFRVLADHFLVHYPHGRDTTWHTKEDGTAAWRDEVSDALPPPAGEHLGCAGK